MGETLYEDKDKLEEYDEEFDGEEKLQHKLVTIQSDISITDGLIDIDNIVTSDFKKVSRSKTVTGLSSLIEDWGVVTPIHVMKLEDDNCYLLLDGLRRIFAAMRKGETHIKAVIWEFSDVDEGKDVAPIISLMINRTQRYSNKETWEVMQRLQDNNVSPGLMEFLLQLNSGEAMKIQDVMMADSDYEEIKQAFLSDELTPETAYKKLCNQRKKEDRLARDDRTVITKDEEGLDTGAGDSHRLLDVDEVKSLLELEDDDEDKSLEELDRTSEVRGVEVQDKDNRHPVDTAIKQAVFIRDNFTCQCCGLGGKQNLAVLVFHHIVGVACGGPDTEENGLTLCQNCHMLLHLYVFGKISVDVKTLSDEEKIKFKKIFKYGNVQIDAWKKVGKSKSEAYKEDAPSRRHLYPGEGLDDLNIAYSKSSADTED